MEYVTRQLVLLLTKVVETLDKHKTATEQIRKSSEQQAKTQGEAIEKFLSAHNESERNRSKSEDRQYGVHNSTRWAAWVTAIATGGAVFAATWYAVITHGMWKEMQTQTGIAKQQFEISEKPWVAGYSWQVYVSIPKPDTFPPEMVGDITANSQVEIRVKNFGKTPALNVQTGGKAYILADGADIPREDESLTMIRAVLPPGDTYLPFRVEVPNNPTKVAEYNSGKKNLYVRARIEYCDLFGNLSRTDFCIYHIRQDQRSLNFLACGPGEAEEDSASAKCKKPY